MGRNESYAHQFKRAIALTGEENHFNDVPGDTLVGQEIESGSALSDWSLSRDIGGSPGNVMKPQLAEAAFEDGYSDG